jgi:hypothetical protein
VKRYLIEILVGTLSGAATFVVIAETYPEWLCSGDKGPVLMGGFFGLPLGSLIGIVIIDKFAYKVERSGIGARILGTVLSFGLSWCGLIATLFLMDSVSSKVAFSAPITVSCACVLGKWIAIRLRFPTNAEN